MTSQSTPIIDQYIAKVKLEPFDMPLQKIEEIAYQIVEGLELKVVKTVSHVFDPCGVTLIFILAQSHLAIHTWPESGLLHIDLVSCVKLNRKKTRKLLADIFSDMDLLSLEVKNIKNHFFIDIQPIQ